MGLVFLDKHKPGAILIGDGLRIVHALYPVILYFVLLALAPLADDNIPGHLGRKPQISALHN